MAKYEVHISNTALPREHLASCSLLTAGVLQGHGTPAEEGNFESEPVSGCVINTLEVLDMVQNSPNDTLLIDVRSENEYNGDSHFGSGKLSHLTGFRPPLMAMNNRWAIAPQYIEQFTICHAHESSMKPLRRPASALVITRTRLIIPERDPEN